MSSIRMCPLCESNGGPTVDRVFKKEKYMDVVQCSKCGFLYMVDIFYETTHSHGLSDVYVRNPNPRRRHYAILDCLDRTGGIAKVAEVGSGHGQLGMLLHSRGYDYLGHEPNFERAKFCSEKGLIVENGCFDSKPNTFDCVILDNVLEHVPVPIQLMREIHGSLKSNGKVLIVVPNAKDLRKFNRKWKNKHLFIPAHINYFTYRSLAQLALKTGYDCVSFKVKFKLKKSILFNLIKMCWKFNFFPTGLYVVFEKK